VPPQLPLATRLVGGVPLLTRLLPSLRPRRPTALQPLTPQPSAGTPFLAPVAALSAVQHAPSAAAAGTPAAFAAASLPSGSLAAPAVAAGAASVAAVTRAQAVAASIVAEATDEAARMMRAMDDRVRGFWLFLGVDVGLVTRAHSHRPTLVISPPGATQVQAALIDSVTPAAATNTISPASITTSSSLPSQTLQPTNNNDKGTDAGFYPIDDSQQYDYAPATTASNDPNNDKFGAATTPSQPLAPLSPTAPLGGAATPSLLTTPLSAPAAVLKTPTSSPTGVQPRLPAFSTTGATPTIKPLSEAPPIILPPNQLAAQIAGSVASAVQAHIAGGGLAPPAFQAAGGGKPAKH
jgi:hypothetical protein